VSKLEQHLIKRKSTSSDGLIGSRKCSSEISLSWKCDSYSLACVHLERDSSHLALKEVSVEFEGNCLPFPSFNFAFSHEYLSHITVVYAHSEICGLLSRLFGDFGHGGRVVEGDYSKSSKYNGPSEILVPPQGPR
jgi:hypothetical protein